MFNTKTVFLVEDDEDDQDIFIHAIDEMENVKLFGVARNGREALERLRMTSNKPSIIFMDINMPVMSGIECLKEITKDPLLRFIPVMMLSSSVQHTDRTRFLGASAFIQKPSDLESFRETLEQLIHGEMVTV